MSGGRGEAREVIRVPVVRTAAASCGAAVTASPAAARPCTTRPNRHYIQGVNAAAGGWETWSWDESLFAGAAGYYEQGRLPYAPGLAGVFARTLSLNGRGRLLDVGCGPGKVTLQLAPLFEAAVGLDPDQEMLACAFQAAARQGVGNVSWVRKRAEDLPADLGSFRAVTFAASFHWMERPRVASAVARMLDPGGAVVQVDAPGYRADELAAEARQGSLPFPPPPDEALDQLRRQYLGNDRRAGRGIRNTSPSGEDQVFQNTGFLPAQTVIVPDQRAIERSADDVVARVFSSSSTAPHLLGDRRPHFEADMRNILAQASPAGRFSVRLPDNILRIWRLPDLRRRMPTACQRPGLPPSGLGDAFAHVARSADSSSRGPGLGADDAAPVLPRRATRRAGAGGGRG
jgi:ubiquinone/menaquinone biosynthesis C-methylase UbiE